MTGGFVLGEIVRRACGQDIRHVLTKEITEPMGLRWTNYGTAPLDVGRVAEDAVTGIRPGPGFSQFFRRALGVGFEEAVEMASDPRFLRGIAPAANGISTAEELSAFYQCLLDEGELDGVRVFEPRTVRHATAEQAYREIDLTLGMPLRYGLGLMLGDSLIGLFKVHPDNTATRVTVRLGKLSVQDVEIKEGLQVGDRVILSDSSQWNDVDRIRLR